MRARVDRADDCSTKEFDTTRSSDCILSSTPVFLLDNNVQKTYDDPYGMRFYIQGFCLSYMTGKTIKYDFVSCSCNINIAMTCNFGGKRRQCSGL